MGKSQVGEAARHLRGAVLLRDGAGLTDGQLLEQYTRCGDEAAFAALVQRNRAVVWGVCRRILGNDPDAEDAFQATFLVLVRKAASLVPREILASWLYGVAHRTALKARATAARRKCRERPLAKVPEPAATERETGRDLAQLLDKELSRLPDKYRVVIILCDLEGRTRKEAARQIRCPEGTVAGRLARGRAMLVKRLARCGLAVSGGALAMALSQNALSGALPGTLVSSTIQTANRLVAGNAAAGGAISGSVTVLMEGVLKTMLLTKLKPIVVLLLLAVLSAAAGLTYRAEALGQPNPNAGTKPAMETRPAAEKAETAIPEKERLRGTWKVVSAVEDGRALKGGAEGIGTWVINDTTIKWVYQLQRRDGKRETTTEVVSFKLDETTRPRSLAVFPRVPESTSSALAFVAHVPEERVDGIYSLAKETLKVCLGSTEGVPRPTAFDSKPGSRHFLLVLQKVSPDYLPTKVYSLAGLTGPKALTEPEAKLLVRVITRTIAPGSWGQGADGSIEFSPPGNLIICQSQEVYEKITEFLRAISEKTGQQ
jgi:RNA polymerase sigma factor (sigma-70 family)